MQNSSTKCIMVTEQHQILRTNLLVGKVWGVEALWAKKFGVTKRGGKGLD